jgi:hypothetical protein
MNAHASGVSNAFAYPNTYSGPPVANEYDIARSVGTAPLAATWIQSRPPPSFEGKRPYER